MLAHSGLPGNLQQAQLSWSGERLQNTFPGLVVDYFNYGFEACWEPLGHPACILCISLVCRSLKLLLCFSQNLYNVPPGCSIIPAVGPLIRWRAGITAANNTSLYNQIQMLLA